jgi:hypothetical protein
MKTKTVWPKIDSKCWQVVVDNQRTDYLRLHAELFYYRGFSRTINCFKTKREALAAMKEIKGILGREKIKGMK